MKQALSFALGILCIGFSNLSIGQGSTNVPTSLSYGTGVASRAPESRAWTDPALNHNKLLQQQQGDGGYRLMGAYKVVGNSYLFGEHLKADMFATEAKAYNIFISYNTYNQEVEFYSTSNPDKPLIKEPGTVDSFIIHQELGPGVTNELRFFYGSALGIKDKYYFQEVCKGERYTLYKRYKSELGYVSGNYVQSDLRQFDLEIEYYYLDAESKGLKKIKPSTGSLTKEFKDVKGISDAVTAEEFSANTETAFCKAFTFINQNSPRKGF